VSVQVIDALKALCTFLQAKAADSVHPLHVVGSVGICGDFTDVRLPAVDIWPGTVSREGQHARQEIVFIITASAPGSYAQAVQEVYEIERALWRVLFSQLTGSAAGKLFHSPLNYQGIVEPPKPFNRGTEEKPEPCVEARARAVWNLKEPLD
jgi:hypothetical protein